MEKESLIKRTLEDLARIYPTGLYEYLFKYNMDTYSQLLYIESRIDQAFLSGTTAELKAILREYWKIHILAIKKFEKIDQSSLDIPKVREEIEEERTRA